MKSPGVQGGSDSMDARIKRSLMERINQAVKAGTIKLLPGDIAAYMRDLERQKVAINYVDGTEEDLRLFLHGRRSTHILDTSFSPQEVIDAFNAAYEPTLRAVRATCQQILDLGKDFSILCCGGGLTNSGFCSNMKKEIDRLRQQVNEKGLQTNIALAFLGEKESMSWLVFMTLYPCEQLAETFS